MVDREMLRLYALRTGLGLKYLSKDEMISVALKQIKPDCKIFIDTLAMKIDRILSARGSV